MAENDYREPVFASYVEESRYYQGLWAQESSNFLAGALNTFYQLYMAGINMQIAVAEKWASRINTTAGPAGRTVEVADGSCQTEAELSSPPPEPTTHAITTHSTTTLNATAPSNPITALTTTNAVTTSTRVSTTPISTSLSTHLATAFNSPPISTPPSTTIMTSNSISAPTASSSMSATPNTATSSTASLNSTDATCEQRPLPPIHQKWIASKFINEAEQELCASITSLRLSQNTNNNSSERTRENAAAITVLDLEAQGTLPTKGEKARLFYLRLSPEEKAVYRQIMYRRRAATTITSEQVHSTHGAATSAAVSHSEE